MYSVFLAHRYRAKPALVHSLTHVLETQGFQVLNPFYNNSWKAMLTKKWVRGERTPELAREIVESDFELVRNSDALVWLYDTRHHSYVGSAMECLLAFLYGKPTVLYSTVRGLRQSKPHFLAVVSAYTESLLEVPRLLRQLLEG